MAASNVPFRVVSVCLALSAAALLTAGRADAQVVGGSNVNMVSGTSFPDGDPYLQRQNEPSGAVSTRNPMHLLAGANDYRTVDLPGTLTPLKGFEANADAWLGLFKSFDGGQTWRSTLIPGFPQDASAEGLASPIHGRQAATDPVVRAGTNGLFYYAGVAFDRGAGTPSAVFLARFMDLNNRESGDPIAYISTSLVAQSGGTPELDKTALAVDIPRSTATCSIPVRQSDGTTLTQTVPAGNVYVAYSAFTGSGTTATSQILFSRSTDCGVTWSAPRNIATGHRLNQNAQIAIDPRNGAVYVSWRRFQSGTQGPAMIVARSANGGATFGKPVSVAPIRPFDQGTSATSFRSNGFQSMAIDAGGRVYVAWTERGHATLRPDTVSGDARIVVSTSTNGLAWTAPHAIRTGGLGHELMPSLTFQGGRLRLLYYTLQEDVSQIFGQYVDELPILSAPDPKPPRHTLDVYVAEATPAAFPVFTAVRVSDYATGVLPGSALVEQLQFNPPNLPLFRLGSVPFMGDYIDLAPAPPFVRDAAGQWTYNVQPASPVTHAMWTDNRDVRAPLDGAWQNYTPVASDAVLGQSRFDPSQVVPPCLPGQTGMRNQNIYTARVTAGLFAGSPGNTKPLGSIQRAFVVSLQNEDVLVRSYRLSIAPLPAGVAASFAQFGAPLTVLDVQVPTRSAVARSVYVTSVDPTVSIRVGVVEIAAPGGAPVPAGLTSTIVLNGDPDNPPLQDPAPGSLVSFQEVYNPDISAAFVATPSIQNPSIQNVVLNPSIQNPSLQNPSIQNPSLQNDAVANPGIINPSIQNPSLQNPSLQNPSLQNPSIQNADLVNGAIEDTTWTVTNGGNTTAAYAIRLVSNGQLPAGFGSQLLLNKTSFTPAAQDCTLALQPHTILLANIANPSFASIQDAVNPSIQNPSIQNATVALAPGETANVTLRIVDPNRFDGVVFDAAAAVTPAIVAQAVNTADAAQGITQPRFALPLTITTAALAPAAPGGAYQATLQTFAGTGATNWSVTGGALPPGLTLNPNTGVLAGTPTTPGNYVFTVQSTDAGGRTDTQVLALQVNPAVPAGFDRVWNAVDTNWSNPKNWSPNGVPPPTDRVYISAAISVSPMLTSAVTIGGIVVEPGATVDTNGFTLTVSGDVSAGDTITGAGTVVLGGSLARISGTFPNLTIDTAAYVLLTGSVRVQGDLTLRESAVLDLNNLSMSVTGSLIVGGNVARRPAISSTGDAALAVAGVNVSALDVRNVALTIGAGPIVQFDHVWFAGYQSGLDALRISHPGQATPFTFRNLSFLVSSAAYVTATDTQDDGVPLVIDIVDAAPADNSNRTTTIGGAIVNWISTPGAANVGVLQTPVPYASGTITYEIAVGNGGPADAATVSLTDTIPAGASFVSATAPSPATCGFASGVVTCTLGALAAGTLQVVTIVVQPAGTGLVTNSVVINAGTPDPDAANNAQTISTLVIDPAAAADLSIVKTGPAGTAAPNTPFSYAIVVRNNGPAPATNVVVSDPVPPSLTVLSTTTDRGTCSGTQQVTCAVGTLASGESATIAVQVSAGTPGLVTNTASVAAAEVDPQLANNASMATTIVANACSVAAFSGPTDTPAVQGEIFLVSPADMNGDGAVDLVLTSQVAEAVTVLANDGTGHFAPLTPINAGPDARGTAIADFDGDGDLDVAASVSTNTGDQIRIFANDGGGALTPAGQFALPAGTQFVLSAGDFNEDGRADLVAGMLGANGPVLLLNDGTGGFPTTTPLTSGISPRTLVIGDFNEDTHLDVAVGHQASTYFSILPGDGQGGFGPQIDIAAAANNRAWPIGDVNGDGHTDLALVEGSAPSQVTVLLGDGTAHFAAHPDMAAGTDTNTVTSADVNGDGLLDLITVHLGSSRFLVQLGDGSGDFGAPAAFASPAFSSAIATDVNADGRPDVAIGDVTGTVHVFYNSCGQPSTDLVLTGSDSPDPVDEGSTLTYALTVTNQAAVAAGNVALSVAFGSNVAVQTAGGTGAACTVTPSAAGGGSIARCTIPSLAPGAQANVAFTAIPSSGGSRTFTAGVLSSGADSDPSNNTLTLTTTVAATGHAIEVVNTNDSGPGSLRQAIVDSNADAGDVDRITFNIPGAGVRTISPPAPLPALSQPATIDGTTQPGYAGTPLIELNGNGVNTDGLIITAGNSRIRGLSINGFGGSGILMVTNGGNAVEGNFIGTDATGTLARGNANGMLILSANNRVGGATAAARNVISANAGDGISIGTVDGNVVSGNFIGTDVTGTIDRGNGSHGVLVSGGSGNRIGGTGAGEGNVISGNHFGISVHVGNGTTIEGNFIGTAVGGSTALGNDTHGINVNTNATGTIIGGPTPAARNVISGNLGSGVILNNGSSGTVLQGNYIGTDAAGAAVLPNQSTGLAITGSPGNTIGGTAPGAGNLVSGNGNTGIWISGPNADGNIVQGNIIGPNASLTAALGNHGVGLGTAADVSGTIIGGTNPGAGNVIAGSLFSDIGIDGANTTVQGNTIGSNPAGTVSLSTVSGGIFLSATAANNTIGGNTVAARNLVTGTVSNGIFVLGQNNRVEGNFVGTTAAGEPGLGNAAVGIGVGDGSSSNTISGNVITGSGFTGVHLSGTSNAVIGNSIGTNAAGTVAGPNFGGIYVAAAAANDTIGGTAPGARNVISGNTQPGINIDGTDIQVIDNFIGTNAAGTSALPNQGGISIGPSGTRATIAGNLISGNVGPGIGLGFGSNGHTIKGNLIGTTAAGAAALGNTFDGISVNSSGNTIGGLDAVSRNVVSGNGRTAIALYNAGASGNVVQGNYVGTNAAGTAAIPNLGLQSGILVLNAPGNTIGGSTAGAGNVVSGNMQHAVTVCCDPTAAGNRVLGNLIGTAPDGTTPLPNGGIGVDIVGAANTRVGDLGGGRNVIAFNGLGVQIRTGASGTNLVNNLILSNNGQAVRIEDAGMNRVGGFGSGTGNTIRSNGAGVVVLSDTSAHNAIVANAIADNGGLGIDLGGDGLTLNDNLDADAGPNTRQNYPVITSATIVGSATAVTGTLSSRATKLFTIQIFSNTVCDSSGHGEGGALVAEKSVVSDANGLAAFSVIADGSGIRFVTATATDVDGNTSEFSDCLTATGPNGLLIVPNRSLNAVQEFDPVSRTVLRTLPLPSPYNYAGAAMLSTILVRDGDRSLMVNVRDGSGTAAALWMSSTGRILRAETTNANASFLQQIGFDPADASQSTVLGGIPFSTSVAAVSPSNGTVTTRFSRAGGNFIGLVTTPGGEVYAGTWCGPDNGAVLRYSATDVFLGVFAAVGTSTGSCEVNGLALDATGAVYVAQNSSNRVAKFDATGTFTGFLTSPTFDHPSSVFVSPLDGLVYVGNDSDDVLTILMTDGTFVASVHMGGSGIGTAGLAR